MAYAPTAIRSAATVITGGVGGAVFSGVVGDAAHSYGYHLARNQLPASDYSVQLAADRDGNGDAASALDISLPPAQMIAVTARLRAAAKAGDPRLYALREFAGTLDGRTTFNRDLSNDGEGFGQWDDSHLWHIHLSGYRRYADDPDAWRAIASVFTDTTDLSSAALGGTQLSEEDDMYTDEDRKRDDGIAWLLGQIKPQTDRLSGIDGKTDIANWALVSEGTGLRSMVAGLAGQLSTGGDVDEAAIAKAVIQGLPDGLARTVLDGLRDRLAA